LDQPFMLAADDDGSLWISAPFGFAVYDMQTGDARWVFFDGSVANSEVSYKLRSVNNTFTSIPVGPTSLLAIDASEFRIDIALLSSELDPTRTITVDPTGSTLTDTTQDTVERFDANGRVTSRMKRTGATVFSATYVASTDHVATLVDGLGGTTQFAYDASGNLQTVTAPSGSVTHVAVDSSGDLGSIVQPDGETYSFTYANHRMTSKTSPDGDVTLYTYASDGTISATSKPAAGDNYAVAGAYTQASQRDAQGNTIHVGTYTDPRGVTHTITVDHHGQIQTDAYTADGQSYVVQNVKATGLGVDGSDETTFSPMLNTRLDRVSYTTVNGLAVGREKTFDNKGRLAYTGRGDPSSSGFLDQIAYDANGRVAAFHPGAGNDQFNIDRDSAGNPIRVWESYSGTATGNETRFTWNGPNGQADTITRHGVTTTIAFDASTGNPSHTVDTMGRVSTLTYDAAGNVASAFDGQTTHTFAYDANNRLTTATDADGNATVLGYGQSSCGCGQQSLVTSIHTPDLAANQAWGLSYGPEGRLATLVDPEGHPESYTYEPTGELRSTTDRLGNSTTMMHDQLGRVQSILDAVGRAHQQAYLVPASTQSIGANVLAGSASATPATTDLTAALGAGDYQIGSRDLETHSLDGQSSRTGTYGVPQVSFYRDATQQVSYGVQIDDARRVTTREDRSGLSFAGEPPLGTTNQASGPSGSYVQEIQGWLPDLPLPLLISTEDTTTSSSYSDASFSYDAQFDVMSAQGYGSTSGQATETYTRDTAGRLTSVSRLYYDVSGSFSAPASSYTYESTSDRVATVVNADGTHTMAYDARGLLHTMTVAGGEGTYTFGYDTLGRNVSLTYPDGHERAQQYDAEGRMTSRCYQYSNGAKTRCYTATYDAVGNLMTMTDPEGTDTFQYDGLYRVTSTTRAVAGQSSVSESYGYNALGALSTNAPETTGLSLDDQRPRLGGTGTAPSAVMNAINGASVSVDPVGHVTHLEGATLAFTKRSLLKSVTASGTTESYLYDSAFRLFGRHFGASIEYYAYEGANRVARLNPDGTAIETYLYDGLDSPLRLLRQQQATYYEVDLAGNVRRLRDASGADLGGYRYTAFGQLEPADAGTPAPSVDQSLRWKGRPFLNVVGGLYDMRARWWSPQLGSFLSIDELAYHDRNSTLWGWPRQNPMRWSDPTGHDGWFDGFTAGVEGGLGIGGGVSVNGGHYDTTSGPNAGASGDFAGGSTSILPVGLYAGAGFYFGYFSGDDPTGPSIDFHVNLPLISFGFGTSGFAVSVGPSFGASVGLGLGVTVPASSADTSPSESESPDGGCQ
jgi:RHS repeat-associated protein